MIPLFTHYHDFSKDFVQTDCDKSASLLLYTLEGDNRVGASRK